MGSSVRQFQLIQSQVIKNSHNYQHSLSGATIIAKANFHFNFHYIMFLFLFFYFTFTLCPELIVTDCATKVENIYFVTNDISLKVSTTPASNHFNTIHTTSGNKLKELRLKICQVFSFSTFFVAVIISILILNLCEYYNESTILLYY